MAEGEIGQCEQTSKSLDSCCWNLISSVFCQRKRGRNARSKRLGEVHRRSKPGGRDRDSKRRAAAKVTGGGNVGMASDLC